MLAVGMFRQLHPHMQDSNSHSDSEAIGNADLPGFRSVTLPVHDFQDSDMMVVRSGWGESGCLHSCMHVCVCVCEAENMINYPLFKTQFSLNCDGHLLRQGEGGVYIFRYK